jgi:hypothetical protein
MSPWHVTPLTTISSAPCGVAVIGLTGKKQHVKLLEIAGECRPEGFGLRLAARKSAKEGFATAMMPLPIACRSTSRPVARALMEGTISP